MKSGLGVTIKSVKPRQHIKKHWTQNLVKYKLRYTATPIVFNVYIMFHAFGKLEENRGVVNLHPEISAQKWKKKSKTTAVWRQNLGD